MANREKNFASAVIYVHNAENRIEEFLKTIIDTMESNFEHSEIICVNDASDDASVEKIKNISASASSTSVSVINMSYFHGLEMAMNAGIDMAILNGRNPDILYDLFDGKQVGTIFTANK